MGGDPSPAAISLRGVTRRFGMRTAVDRVSLDVPAGQSVAMFGPNGAGKTTLLRLVSLALRPQSGTITIGGLPAHGASLAIRARLGVLGHRTQLYDELSARENLELFGGLYGVADPATRAESLLAAIDLAHRADEPVRGFSRGMRQRLARARALVHDPPLVLLDEPFSGLDIDAEAGLFDAIGELRAAGRTILLATHDLERGLALADRVLVLGEGRVVDDLETTALDIGTLRGRYRDRLRDVALAR